MSELNPDNNPDQSENLRWFAERIIAGEFKSVLIAMCDGEGMVHVYHPGAHLESIGLAEWSAFYLKNYMLNGE